MLCVLCVFSHTVVLVLVQPLVAIICEEFILSKGCVHKAVHKRRSQVHPGRVHLGATASKPCHIQHKGDGAWVHLAQLNSKSQNTDRIKLPHFVFNDVNGFKKTKHRPLKVNQEWQIERDIEIQREQQREREKHFCIQKEEDPAFCLVHFSSDGDFCEVVTLVSHPVTSLPWLEFFQLNSAWNPRWRATKKKKVPGTRYHHPVENPKNGVELSQVKLSCQLSIRGKGV